jgi:predicted AlkP superfamily phosphohydrolase/phosphomutase
LRRHECILVLAPLLLIGCSRGPYKKVIVIGVDGMDPAFVERHWADLPNLTRLRDRGSYSHLETTDPPQSPVAWSTFITGLDPGEHGIFDFVHRDPVTLEPYLSTDKTFEPRFRLPLGPYELPLSRSRVVSLRKGRAFWEYLSDAGIPVAIVRIPANYPPSKAGHELAGMGTPDLRGTQGTFTYFTDDPAEMSRDVSGGMIRKVGAHAELNIPGPPNTLRRDRAYTSARLIAEVDPERPYVRLQIGTKMAILREGEWSEWLKVDFSLVPHVASVHGMFRVFAKQLHPRFELYVSPINVDPDSPALPISTPASYAREIGERTTLGIGEDTSALRQGVFDLPQFLAQSRLVLDEERRLLDESLRRFTGGFLFFYFSAIDQNSHVLWAKHEAELLGVYRAVDESIGEAMRREPGAELIVMSDHGFAAFDRAFNLNTFLASRGFRAQAYALGLNGLYLRDKRAAAEISRELLGFRDPSNGRQVIESVTETKPSAENRGIAPDLIVGYAAGYRASWETALGEAPSGVLEDNNDAWIADHCIDPREVPAVLFTTAKRQAGEPKLNDLPVSLLAAFGVARPQQMMGRRVF